MSEDRLGFLKTELATLDQQGLRNRPRVLSGEQKARTVFDGRAVINLASNNYLGLAAHPRLKEAASRAALEFGAGSGAVRTIAGTMSLHEELEQRFAAFKHAPAALMFQSGFVSNAGTVAAILTREDVIVSDQLNHASIIDGARLSRAEIKVFPHKDVSTADSLVGEATAAGKRVLLITDGVFSMDGDIAPLPGLVDVAERHGAIMMVDDAHASGVLGSGGAGTVDHFDLHGRVDIQVGTLSKAIGVLGGFIAGPQHLIDWLINRGRPFLFSTSAPPAVAAACIEALDVIRDEPERLERLWSNTRFFKEGLHGLGFDTGASETPITPVIAGEEHAAQELASRLFDAGVFTPAIVFPTVPKGTSRVRTIVTSDHTQDDLSEALAAFEKVGKELAIIRSTDHVLGPVGSRSRAGSLAGPREVVPAMADRADWNRRIIEEFRANAGVVGGPFEGTPLLLLHTKGAKTGEARVNPVAYQKVGDAYAVFASKGGAPTNPDWYHNLLADPKVTAEVGDETFDAVARVAEGDERERIWTTQKERNPGFAGYERNTTRQIPVVILEPAT